jgi:hypothetical protein
LVSPGETPKANVDAKLQLLEPLHKKLSTNSFVIRMGQTLEIAVWRALSTQADLKSSGPTEI